MKGRVVSKSKRESQAGKTYWKVTIEKEDGDQKDVLCFDEQIDKVGDAYFDFSLAEKGDATFLNFPRAEGDKATGRSGGGSRTDDPKTRLMSAHTMLLSYAKDIALADPRGDNLGDLLSSVNEAYQFLHNVLFTDGHVKEIIK
jgi:prepilin-type processing-associated H-X9-DG protein